MKTTEGKLTEAQIEMLIAQARAKEEANLSNVVMGLDDFKVLCDMALESLKAPKEAQFTIEEMRRAVRAAALMGIRGVLDQDAWKREWNDESLADKIVNRLEGVKP